MATSGYTDAWVTSWDTLRFNWWQVEQSIPYNYTKVGWRLELIAGSSGRIDSSTSKAWWVNVNGSYYDGTNTVGIANNTTKTLASGETIVYHNSDGSKQFSYSFSQYFGINFSGRIESVSGSGSAWLESIPRKATAGSVSNFDDVTNPTIYFNHPAGNALELQICMTSGKRPDGTDIFITSYRRMSEEDIARGYYTFNLKEDYGNGDTPQTRIWNKSVEDGSDTIDVTFHLATWINGQFEYSQSNTVKCTVTDCEPTLNPTVVDTGALSTYLTNNSQPNSNTIIRYCNYVTATFNATAKKGASIVSRSVKCGNQNKTASGDYAIFQDVDNKTFVFTIRDNRGKTAEKTASFNELIEYNNLTCAMTIDKELNGETADIILNITGDYFSGSFGSVNNKLTVEYRYKDGNNDFPDEWTPALTSGDPSGGTYAIPVTIPNLYYKGTYTIQARARDSVHKDDYIYAKDEIVKIIPVFDWGENDFNFNVPVTMQGKDVRTYGSDRIARAYTQETDISYASNSYIKLFRDGSPTDLYNQNIATFNENGTITINKDMTALINVHVLSYNGNDNQRSWIRLMNYNANWQYTACIAYGLWSTSDFSIVLNFSEGTIIGLVTGENMTINSGGPTGSYIEIIEL